MGAGCFARQTGPLGQVRAEAGPDAAVEGAAGSCVDSVAAKLSGEI